MSYITANPKYKGIRYNNFPNKDGIGKEICWDLKLARKKIHKCYKSENLSNCFFQRQKNSAGIYTYKCSFLLALKHIKNMNKATSILIVNDENFSRISTNPCKIKVLVILHVLVWIYIHDKIYRFFLYFNFIILDYTAKLRINIVSLKHSNGPTHIYSINNSLTL